MRAAFASLVLVASACTTGQVSDGTGDAGASMDARPAEGRNAGVTDVDATDAAIEDTGGAMARRIGTWVAFGSSSTAGAGASAPERAYVGVLEARITARFPSAMLTNLGAGGATIDRFVASLPSVTPLEPELVTILPLTDYVRTATATFRAGYARLFDALGAAGATVFLGDLRIDPALVCGTGSGPGGCYAPQDRALLDAKNAIAAELAATRAHVIVVPIFDQNVAHPEWNAADGAHPNDLGHAYLADAFWGAVEPWLDGR
ncbi:SGNH/GDSL hydrolase family protein [Myxococcota bacterium]|nr:SGNH/GDSL hydrolase family protein [Myxococcota bacterium]